MPMPSPSSPPAPAEDESGSGDHPSVLLAECQRLLDAVPAAAATSPAFRRHWPSISASLAALSAALATPAFPSAAPLLAPLAAALRALLSVSSVPAAGDAQPRLGHLHTVSLLSSTNAELAQLAADARLLAAPAPAPSASVGAAASGGPAAEDALVSRLRMGSAASRAAALEELASTAASLPAPSAAAAVNAVAALLDSATACSGDLRERAVGALAALASSDLARPALAQEAGAVVPHLCRALESGSSATTTQHACAALLPLTSSSRDACAAVCARGGVAALLCACAGGTPAAQAAAAGVLRSLAAHADLLPAFRADEGDIGGAVPLLLQLVSLGTPRAQEQALGCLQRLTAGDGDDAQRLKVEAFQAGALACVRDFLDGYDSSGGGGGGESSEPPGLAPALGLLRNMASFRYIAEIAAASGGGTFVAHVVAALGSDRSATRAEAALALAELCGNAGNGSMGKAARQQHEAVVADAAVPRLVWMLEAKSAPERDAAARALAAVLAASSACRKAFRRDERGVVNAVQLLGGGVEETERRFPVSVLLAVAPSRRCRKQMVAAGACGFLQALVGAEVDGAKRLAECLGKGKMLGVFPRT